MCAGRVSEHHTRVSHDGPYASFVECHLVSKGHFTPLTDHGVESTENKRGTVTD
nr:hypothetical protein [Acinetobacter baumannii]